MTEEAPRSCDCDIFERIKGEVKVGSGQMAPTSLCSKIGVLSKAWNADISYLIHTSTPGERWAYVYAYAIQFPHRDCPWGKDPLGIGGKAPCQPVI